MNKNEKKQYTHRYLARIVIEAETPLAVGSGEKDLVTDALVATDSNGLPYIPGTSIAGVLRSMTRSVASEEEVDALFGFQGTKKSNDGHDEAVGHGSEIIFTEAKILDSEGRVMDGLHYPAEIAADSLLMHYSSLPVRQHVRITDKGTAANTGLFSSQVVYSGSRFCFEIEMVSDGSNYNAFESVLRRLFDLSFRIGGGTRDGFGKIRVVDMQVIDLDLRKKDDLDAYLDKTSSLDSSFWSEQDEKADIMTMSSVDSSEMVCYRLELRPESFFQFGSGYSDEEADMTPVKARKVVWDDSDGKLHASLKDDFVLIPATSLKGALAHRVAFHWNRHKQVFADLQDPNIDFNTLTGGSNDAVTILFGAEGDHKGTGASRGNLIFSDIIATKASDKIFNHIKIDRFTGGGIEGALFSEKATYGEDQCYITEILLDKKSLQNACNSKADTEPDAVIHALESALNDLCLGMLPLGGGVNRGHGVFTGKLKIVKDEENGKN